MKRKSLFILLLTWIPILTFGQELSFNQLVGFLQKAKNNNHSISNVINSDLKDNSPIWKIDDLETGLIMQDTKLETYVYIWKYTINNEELYRLGVSKEPINSVFPISIFYWFPSQEVYNTIKNKAIEFGAELKGRRIQDDGTITYLYATEDYVLILNELPPDVSYLTINGQKKIGYSAIIGYGPLRK